MKLKRNKTTPQETFPDGEQPVNISRRRFLLGSAGTMAGALVLGFGLPLGKARAAQDAAKDMAPGTRVPAFLEIRPDNKIRFQSPFVEGGQGIFTAMSQIVGEELDADPSWFIVNVAPPGSDYLVMNGGGRRITGGSMSVRTSYETMRRLGALARQMLLEAAADQWQVPVTELTTEPGKVIHAKTGKSLTYGELAEAALGLPVPDVDTVELKDPNTFRWIGEPINRLDVYDKSVGKAQYTIDMKVDNMLQAAVQHAPRMGLTVARIRNEQQVKQMKGVHSVHQLPGAVAVVAERWWNAKRAAEALQVEWHDPGQKGSANRYMPSDFSSDKFAEQLAKEPGTGEDAEVRGDVNSAYENATTKVSATYHSQFLNHAQLEPPSALVRYNDDGTLELWLPNQAPEMFVKNIAKHTGVAEDKIILHSPILGGFFGRHFVYETAMCYQQAAQLAKAVGRPIKLIWSREEEFLRDTHRPMAAARFRGALDDNGMPVALEAVSVTEGPGEGIGGNSTNKNAHGKKIDESAVEGLTGKPYAISNHRIAQVYVKGPVMLGYWRSVGNSMNDFLYETFLDELADAGSQDPYEMRKKLLKDNARLSHLLDEVVALSGGWKRGPYTAADGSRRARGVAMASPFGSHAAAIAEVSIVNGEVKVHDVWEAIDPGSIVNPAIIEAQVHGAAALGLSQALLEETVYQEGMPQRNYDLYRILPPSKMADIHVKIVESGEKMGGIGEPPLPAVAPAVVNAVSHLTGKRIRRLPLSRQKF